MKRRLINFLYLSLILLLCTTICIHAHQRAATESHDTLKKLKFQFQKMLGFVSRTEIELSVLGKPIKEYRIGLNALVKYKPGQDPKKLLVDVQRVHYPVSSGGRLISCVSLRKEGKHWKLTAIGEQLIHFVQPTKSLLMQLYRTNREDLYFMVYIPGMYQVFVGHYSGNTLYLTPTHYHPVSTFELHKSHRADDILLQLKSQAATYIEILPGKKK